MTDPRDTLPRTRRRLGALALLLWAVAATPTGAQDTESQPARMAADSLEITADGALVATGGVEVLYRGARLRAERLVYTRGTDGAPDRLEITGPIVLEDGPDVLILADAAEMSADLRDGVLRGARIVLDRRLQIATRGVERREGRITRMERAVASSCQICADTPTPLWEIRAARITHDSEAQTLEFERAAFRVMGVTLAVVPRLRMPDPTVTRMSGVLAPELLATSALGPGLRVPYFIALGANRDLTLSPRVHARGSYTLGGAYRHNFARGRLALDGAVTRDRLRPGEWRGYVEARADVALAPDTGLGLRLEAFSDPRYRSDYGVGEDDIRTNTIFIDQIRRDRMGRVRATQFRTFRGSDNARLPNRVLDAHLSQRVTPPVLGGSAWLTFDALAARRDSSNPVMGRGRDVARLTLRADWRRAWITPAGVEVAALGALQADQWRVRQDDRFARTISRISPTAALELRWPLVRQAPGGATHLLEPIAQLVWARNRRDVAPNEDSLLLELDEVTLFRLDRGPGFDTHEAGRRINLGLGWTRHDPAGWSIQALAGRVVRLRGDGASTAEGAFSGPVSGPVSGLEGRRSDWLAAARLQTAGGLAFAGRAIVTPDGRSPRQEFRASWTGDGRQVYGSYVQIDPDAVQDRTARTGELGLGGAMEVGRHWLALANLRYDLARGEPGTAGIGARYRNECVEVDLSLSRRFVSSTSVAARTEIGLRIDIIGFGARPGGPVRRCGQ